MKKILIITYYFPPYNGGGMIRVHNFVKHLPKLGFLPLVLTVKDKYYENAYTPQLLDEYPKEVKIFRTNSLDLKGMGRIRQEICGISKKSFFDRIILSLVRNKITRKLSRDRALLWTPYAVSTGMRIFKENGFDLIFSTCPPFGNNIIAHLLHKLTKRPFVLDYRDSWVGNELCCPRSCFLQFMIEKRIEHTLIQIADKVLTTTPELMSSFKEKYSDISANKCECLLNGYDPEYFRENHEKKNLSHKIHFVYTGSLAKIRNPKFFLFALKKLLKEDIHLKDKVEVTFIGFTHYMHKELVNSLGLKENVSFIENLHPRETVRFLREKADVCVLFQRSVAGGKTAIPGKIYEYLASRKPILCMDDRGATSKFLARIGSNLNTDYEDIEKIKHLIKVIVNNYQKIKNSYIWDKGFLKDFDRERQTEKLAQIFNKILE